MKKVIIIIIIFGVVTWVNSSNNKLFYNGGDWSDWPKDGKMGYILGFEDGLRMGDAISLKMKVEFRDNNISAGEIIERLRDWFDYYYQLDSVSFDELRKNIDSFYRNESNKNIPMVAATPLLSMKMKGIISQAEFKIKMRELRFEYK